MNRRVARIKYWLALAKRGLTKCDRCRPNRAENGKKFPRRSWKHWRRWQWRD